MRPATLLGFHSLPWIHNCCPFRVIANLLSTTLAAKGGGSDTHRLFHGGECILGARLQA